MPLAALLFPARMASRIERHFTWFHLGGVAEMRRLDDQLPQITASLLSRRRHLQGERGKEEKATRREKCATGY